MDAAIFIANRCIVNPLQLRLSESVLLYGTRQYYIHTCVPDLVGTYRETVERYNNNGRRVKKKKLSHNVLMFFVMVRLQQILDWT